jgi:hypothetical protein
MSFNHLPKSKFLIQKVTWKQKRYLCTVENPIKNSNLNPPLKPKLETVKKHKNSIKWINDNEWVSITVRGVRVRLDRWKHKPHF